MTQFKRGDRVAYRAQFLRDIGDYSYARALLRGLVTEHGPDGWLVLVLWDDETEPRGVHEGNILSADKIPTEPV